MKEARMMVRSDARSNGMVTSLTTRVSERWQGSGTKSGECVSIFPDGSRVPFNATRKSAPKRLAAVKATRHDAASHYNDMLDKFGAIGNGESD